jgi:quercetin dioxygenase-like cupin family protein
LRHADQPVWRDPQSGYLRREVAPAGTGSPTRIVEVDFPAGGEVVFRPGGQRPAEQHVWVLEGEIEVALGAVTYALTAGDCLHMRVSEVSSFRNTSTGPARYAVILTTKEPLP